MNVVVKLLNGLDRLFGMKCVRSRSSSRTRAPVGGGEPGLVLDLTR